MTGNTSCSIPAPGLPGPITGPQLAAACPLQEPGFQLVHITATEPRLTAIDESSSLSKDPPTQSRNSLTANSQIRLWMYFISNKFVHPQTFSRNPPSQILLLSRVQSSIRMGAPRMGGASANRAHPHSPVQIPQSLSSARPYNAL